MASNLFVFKHDDNTNKNNVVRVVREEVSNVDCVVPDD